MSLTLARLAGLPLITYEAGYTGAATSTRPSAAKGLAFNLVLSAMDADVIKTYVELGMGVGLIAAIAYDEERDARLAAIDARHLFASNMTRLAVRRGRFLRSYEYDFIQTFVPPLTRERLRQALAAPPGDDFAI